MYLKWFEWEHVSHTATAFVQLLAMLDEATLPEHSGATESIATHRQRFEGQGCMQSRAGGGTHTIHSPGNAHHLPKDGGRNIPNWSKHHATRTHLSSLVSVQKKPNKIKIESHVYRV